MFLESKHISDIQRIIEAGNDAGLEKLRGAEISLTSALFLALTSHSLGNSGKKQLAQKIAMLNLPGVADSIACLEQQASRLSSDPFGAPAFDLYRIGSKQDLISPEWTLFYDRFRRAAAQGRSGKMYRAVAGVLGEMGDNVVWHAFEAEDQPCAALAAFHVNDDTASFCVADSGQGFLCSLRRSQTWTGLKNDQEALDAVVNKHATSRPGETEGGGFKQLFNSLLDLNGLVILRSGSCTLVLENSDTIRHQVIRHSIPIPGSSVTVVISASKKPQENTLK
jgi:hypothetical protein